jgi:hypothetical protein
VPHHLLQDCWADRNRPNRLRLVAFYDDKLGLMKPGAYTDPRGTHSRPMWELVGDMR